MTLKHCDGLWLCLYFQQLPVEIFTRDAQSDKPVVIKTRQRISHANMAARAMGIRIGSSMDAAYTIDDGVVGFERDEEKELFALNNLSQWAYQFTPSISIKPPHSLLLDIRSSLKLFNGIDNIKTHLYRGLQRLGYIAVLGVHRTPLAAACTAHAGLGDESPLLKIPAAVLDVDTRIIESLQQMGMHSVGDVLALPRSGLTRRFGVFFSDYLQRLTGEKPDPQKFVGEKPAFDSEITFLADVTNLESLVFPIRRLLQELSEFLSSRQLKIDSFTFKLSHRYHQPKSFSIYLAEPESDLQMFLLLTQLQLEKIDDVEEIDTIKLSARNFFSICSIISSTAASGDLFHGTRFQQRDGRSTAISDRENANRLLNILNARLGADTCFGLSLGNDHRPEKAWKVVHRRDQKHPIQLADRTGNHRPLFLLPSPRALHSCNDEGHPLLLLNGPERIDFGWWDDNIARDYYVARHPSGPLYWVFKEQSSHQWYLHGVFS